MVDTEEILVGKGGYWLVLRGIQWILGVILVSTRGILRVLERILGDTCVC